MSTFLELVQDVARESGTLAGGVNIGSVVDVTGRADKVVSWTRKAWRNIQNERRDWLWLQAEFQDTLAVESMRYTAASFNITRLREWRLDRRNEDGGTYYPITIYDSAIGQSDESTLRNIAYETWRTRYDRQTHVATRPTEYAISPTNELCIGAKPDKAYVIRGEYVKSPQTLTIDADTPEMPSEYHDLIVWEAMRLLAKADGSIESLQFADDEYKRLRFQLTASQLPRMMIDRTRTIA